MAVTVQGTASATGLPPAGTMELLNCTQFYGLISTVQSVQPRRAVRKLTADLLLLCNTRQALIHP